MIVVDHEVLWECISIFCDCVYNALLTQSNSLWITLVMCQESIQHWQKSSHKIYIKQTILLFNQSNEMLKPKTVTPPLNRCSGRRPVGFNSLARAYANTTDPCSADITSGGNNSLPQILQVGDAQTLQVSFYFHYQSSMGVQDLWSASWNGQGSNVSLTLICGCVS